VEQPNPKQVSFEQYVTCKFNFATDNNGIPAALRSLLLQIVMIKKVTCKFELKILLIGWMFRSTSSEPHPTRMKFKIENNSRISNVNFDCATQFPALEKSIKLSTKRQQTIIDL